MNDKNHQNHQVIIEDKDKACKWYKWTLVVSAIFVSISIFVFVVVSFIWKEELETLYAVLDTVVLVVTALLVLIVLLVVGHFKRDYEKKWNLYVRNVLNKQ